MIKQGTVGKRKWRKWNRGAFYRNTTSPKLVLVFVLASNPLLSHLPLSLRKVLIDKFFDIRTCIVLGCQYDGLVVAYLISSQLLIGRMLQFTFPFRFHPASLDLIFTSQSSPCRPNTSLSCHHFTPPLHHLVTPPPHRLVTLSPCHLVTPPPHRLVTLSPCHLVTPPPHRLVTLSPCHLVTPPSRPCPCPCLVLVLVSSLSSSRPRPRPRLVLDLALSSSSTSNSPCPRRHLDLI